MDRELNPTVDGRQSARSTLSEPQSTSRSEVRSARSEDLRIEKEGAVGAAGAEGSVRHMPPPTQAYIPPPAAIPPPPLGPPYDRGISIPVHSGQGNGPGLRASEKSQEGMEVDVPLGDVNRQESDEIFRRRALAIMANSIRSSTTSSSSSISLSTGKLSPRAPTTATAVATAAAAAAAAGGYPARLPVSSNSSGLDSFDEAFHALDEIVFPSSVRALNSHAL